MKKYAFIFTAFLIAAALIGCGNPAGGNANNDNRGIGTFEQGLWYYDYLNTYFVFDTEGKILYMYTVQGKTFIRTEYNGGKKSDFETLKNKILQEDKRDTIPFFKVAGDIFDTPFRTGWYCEYFTAKEKDHDTDLMIYILFSEESTFEKVIAEKIITKSVTKKKDSGDKTTISNGDVSSLSNMDWYLFLININEMSKHYSNFKFERCNESDVPTVSP